MKNKGIKIAKKAFQSRPRRFSVIWMLPNFLTICALIFGLQAMYQAIFNNWDSVIIMVIIASVFDMLDGRVARLLKSTSEFGMHLDSLSDFVVFGAVPAFSVYLWMDKPQGNFLSRLIEGGKFALKTPIIAKGLFIVLISAFFVRGMLEIQPTIAGEILKQGSFGLSLITTTAGIGALIASIWIGVRKSDKIKIETKLVSILFLGLFVSCIIGFI